MQDNKWPHDFYDIFEIYSSFFCFRYQLSSSLRLVCCYQLYLMCHKPKSHKLNEKWNFIDARKPASQQASQHHQL